MKIVKILAKSVKHDEKLYEYSYRLTAIKMGKKEIFGLEVERFDYLDGELINIERDSIKKISDDVLKVAHLFDIISQNIVSPIHLVDVLSEYVDNYVSEIEEREVAYI